MQATRGAPLAATAGPVAPRRRTTFLLLAAALILLADLVSKALVVAHITPGDRIQLLGHFLQLTNTRNSGAAFSVGTRATVVFTAVAVVVVVAILRTATRLRSIGWAVALGLLLGGALGNLVDRLFRYPGVFRGHVVDWIELPHWPVFNLADSAIVVGGVIAVLLASRGITVEGKQHGGDPDHNDESPSEPDRA